MNCRVCVIWDIDGTLVRYIEPNEQRYRQYFNQYGVPSSSSVPELVGTTEAGIMSSYLGTNDMSVIQFHLRRMDAIWYPARGSSEAIGPAQETLVALRDHAMHGVVTGNTFIRGVAKLVDAGFDLSMLDLGASSFGDESVDRGELVKSVMARCALSDPDVTCWRFVCVGDTPLDEAAAAQAGVPSILVATGRYSVSELMGGSSVAVLHELTHGAETIVRFMEHSC